MKRSRLWVLLITLGTAISGCSEPESPRFVPATTATATTNDREPTQKPANEAGPMIKIPMH